MSDRKISRRYFGRWVRSYVVDLDDPARQSLSDALYRTMDDLERLADLTDGVLPGAPEIAFRLRLKPREVDRRLAALAFAAADANRSGAPKPPRAASFGVQNPSRRTRQSPHDFCAGARSRAYRRSRPVEAGKPHA